MLSFINTFWCSNIHIHNFYSYSKKIPKISIFRITNAIHSLKLFVEFLKDLMKNYMGNTILPTELKKMNEEKISSKNLNALLSDKTKNDRITIEVNTTESKKNLDTDLLLTKSASIENPKIIIFKYIYTLYIPVL